MTDKPTYRTGFSPFSVNILFVVLILAGVSLAPLLNIQLTPSSSLPSIRVNWSWPDASALVIEQEVTGKLEGMFSGVSGVRGMSSVSARGRGHINISFKKEASLDAARFEIATLVRRAYPELPPGVTYPNLSLGTGGSRRSSVLSYTLSAGSSPWHIQQYAENSIVPKISALNGVNEVNVYGANPFEWEITFDAERIRNLGISANDVAQAVNNYTRREIIGMGDMQILGNGPRRQIQVSFQLDNPPAVDWDRIPVKKTGTRTIYLGDVAKVRYKEQLPTRYFRINGLNTINLIVYAEEDANHLNVAERVKNVVNGIILDLPPGYSILLANDTTDFIYEELQKVGFRTLASVVVLLIFVLAISRQWRYLLLIVISLAANLVIAFIFYYLLNIEIHLYSMAGITVSFGIIIDNSIVMIDHYKHHRNRKVFLAILAATLTTIASLSVIFFLEESQRINLVDFAWVMIVNLAVSLGIALFFIPSMMEKLPLRRRMNRRFFRRSRRVVRAGRLYMWFILFTKRWKWVFITLLVLGFGIPMHWLPEKLEDDDGNRTAWTTVYNSTLGSDWYNDRVREKANLVLGGSLRLFTEHVYRSSYYASPERTTLHVNGRMPEGTTVHQLNDAVKIMENYLGLFDEIRIFETTVSNYNNSSITIHFKPEHEFGSFPWQLKEMLTSKAISLGGLDWSVYGVGRGFSNALHSGRQSHRIRLEGYNYNQLYSWSEYLVKRLRENPRVQDPEITATPHQGSTLHEFYLDFDAEKMTLHDQPMDDFYTYLREQLYRDPLNPLFDGSGMTPVTMVSDRADDFSTWWLRNAPVEVGDRTGKLLSSGSIEKRKTGNEIHRHNQQYRLYVAYNFIGPYQLADNVREALIEEMSEVLPLGFRALKGVNWGQWDRQDSGQYYLILLIIAIVYVICSILLESFRQPLAIIALIPVSFIGVFLTYYLFNFNFDQGGLAAFILLCGLTVNSGLYIVNDYNQFRKENRKKSNLRIYLKAFNHKVIPVFLTLISTMLGLIPFVWGGQNEVFWFAFASGAIGGLVFSIIALILYLPMFVKTDPALSAKNHNTL